MRNLLLLGLCVPLTACAGLPAGDPNLLATGLVTTGSVLPHRFVEVFPGAPSILAGFDDCCPGQPAPWRIGETALYAVELTTGSETERKLARLTVASEGLKDEVVGEDRRVDRIRSITIQANDQDVVWSSPVRLIEVRAYDAEGVGSSPSLSIAPDRAFEEGMVGAARAATRLMAGESPGGYVQHMAAAAAALTNFTELVAANGTLGPIFWKTVRRPSLWSLVTRGGVSISIKMDTQNVSLVPDYTPRPHGVDEVYRVPVTILGNGQPMLHAALWVTTPAPPLRVGGGILRVDGYRPGDADTKFTIRMVAARIQEAGGVAVTSP